MLRWSATASASGRRQRPCRIAYASSNAPAPRTVGAVPTRAQSLRSSSPLCAAPRLKVVLFRSQDSPELSARFLRGAVARALASRGRCG
jgi:hypothetical protein